MNYFKFISITLLLISNSAQAQCVNTTKMLEQMEESFIELTNEVNESVLLRVKVADEIGEQAAGFQHICAERFADTAILFVFKQAKRPTFHMNNVYANLDIAFIDESGLISDIQLMLEEFSSGERTLYPSDVITKYALEVHEGYYEKNNIKSGNSRLKIGNKIDG